MTTPNGNVLEKIESNSKSLKSRRNLFHKLFRKKKSQKSTSTHSIEEGIENLNRSSHSMSTNVNSSQNNVCYSTKVTNTNGSPDQNHNQTNNVVELIADQENDRSIENIILPHYEPSLTDSLKKARHLFFESLSCHDSDIGDLSIISHDNSFHFDGNKNCNADVSCKRTNSKKSRFNNQSTSEKPGYVYSTLLTVDHEGFVKIEVGKYHQLLDDINYLKAHLSNLHLLLQHSCMDIAAAASTDS